MGIFISCCLLVYDLLNFFCGTSFCPDVTFHKKFELFSSVNTSIQADLFIYLFTHVPGHLIMCFINLLVNYLLLFVAKLIFRQIKRRWEIMFKGKADVVFETIHG